ncbi:metal-binding protein [Acaryochloris sp. 'Moss Beach']|uniref:SWIM zinc finger family protein n=1 Tax=Acaryochloris TaxID=155977 RepID=UPI001BB05B50|nr:MULTISPECIES: metal-binding protein [Acaryochloris]QUY44541.1 metal-binding protein [Acaryochloris marina S15]UJB69318.1 metal-binding protein [Acaryochloris sp. 'Moss Beach']
MNDSSTQNNSSGTKEEPSSKPQLVSLRAKSTDSQSGDVNGPGKREWWAQRWVDVLESFGWRRRLERARNYVRDGRVLKLEFNGPKVVAQVQGTAEQPYKVSLALDSFTDEQWGFVIEEMSLRAIFAAKLLAGEMPQNIEEAFTASGLSLFPFSKFDIHSRCSCPDPVNPCKHIGAVYYLLGDYFSQDPFILLQLRGRTKQSIVEDLRQMRSVGSEVEEGESKVTDISQSLAIKVKTDFWRYDQQLDPSLVVITPPPTSETVLDVLGPLPLSSEGKVGGDPLVSDCLRTIYQRVSQSAMMKAMLSRESE